MKCEFDLCIYNKNSACTLEIIQINACGICDDCEIVTIPKEAIDKYKSHTNEIYDI